MAMLYMVIAGYKEDGDSQKNPLKSYFVRSSKECLAINISPELEPL